MAEEALYGRRDHFASLAYAASCDAIEQTIAGLLGLPAAVTAHLAEHGTCREAFQ